MNRKLEIYYSDDSNVNISTSPKKHLKKEYGRYFEEEIINIASNKNLNGTDLRVFLCIIGNLEYENILNISQKKLGEMLGIGKKEISKSINKLIKEEYLQIIDKIGRQNIYKFNPNIVFKSRAKNHKQLQDDWKADNNQFENDQSNNADKKFQNKFDKKINEISKKFDIEKEKAKDILFSFLNEESNITDVKDLPY